MTVSLLQEESLHHQCGFVMQTNGDITHIYSITISKHMQNYMEIVLHAKQEYGANHSTSITKFQSLLLAEYHMNNV